MKRPGRILHLLSQRPGETGSGTTLQALVREAARTGWEQEIAVGLPADAAPPRIDGVAPERWHPLLFAPATDDTSPVSALPPGTVTPRPALDFPVPGMSDIMPYPSTRFAALRPAQLEAYRGAWRRHLEQLVARFRPDLIHSHHVWILSALVKDAAPGVPVVTHCHATGLRQMELCPHLAAEVRRGCARNDLFLVLHRGHARELAAALEIDPARIRIVGAGYREAIFHPRGRCDEGGPRVLYAGKIAEAKGLSSLLDALESLTSRLPDLELHVAGGGSGEEAERLSQRMAATGGVITHGRLDQEALAALARRCHVFVLPSFYEGLPLVLIEALACGCRLVATDLPAVRETLAPMLGDILEVVPRPRLTAVDRPLPADLPAFAERLAAAILRSLDRDSLRAEAAIGATLEPFTWSAVFERVEAAWRSLMDNPQSAARRATHGRPREDRS